MLRLDVSAGSCIVSYYLHWADMWLWIAPKFDPVLGVQCESALVIASAQMSLDSTQTRLRAIALVQVRNEVHRPPDPYGPQKRNDGRLG